MHRPNSLPNTIIGILTNPYPYLREHEYDIHHDQDNACSQYLYVVIWYYFECEAVLALLPDEVAEEDDCEVVVGSYEAAEEAHELW